MGLSPQKNLSFKTLNCPNKSKCKKIIIIKSKVSNCFHINTNGLCHTPWSALPTRCLQPYHLSLQMQFQTVLLQKNHKFLIFPGDKAAMMIKQYYFLKSLTKSISYFRIKALFTQYPICVWRTQQFQVVQSMIMLRTEYNAITLKKIILSTNANILHCFPLPPNWSSTESLRVKYLPAFDFPMK